MANGRVGEWARSVRWSTVKVEDSDSTELAEVLSAVAFALCSRSASQARQRSTKEAAKAGEDDEGDEEVKRGWGGLR